MPVTDPKNTPAATPANDSIEPKSRGLLARLLAFKPQARHFFFWAVGSLTLTCGMRAATHLLEDPKTSAEVHVQKVPDGYSLGSSRSGAWWSPSPGSIEVTSVEDRPLDSALPPSPLQGGVPPPPPSHGVPPLPTSPHGVASLPALPFIVAPQLTLPHVVAPLPPLAQGRAPLPKISHGSAPQPKLSHGSTPSSPAAGKSIIPVEENALFPSAGSLSTDALVSVGSGSSHEAYAILGLGTGSGSRSSNASISLSSDSSSVLHFSMAGDLNLVPTDNSAAGGLSPTLLFIPEPSIGGLLAVALAGFALKRHRKPQSAA